MKVESNKVLQRITLTPTSAVLLLGLALGFLADQLFGTVGPVGLGFFIWSNLFALALGWLVFRVRGRTACPVVGWSVVAIAAAGLILFRTTPLVVSAMLLAMVVAMAMIVLHLGGLSLLQSTLTDHLRALSLLPFQGGLGAWPIVSSTDFSTGLKHPQLWAALRGAMLALPLIVVFGILFSSADAGFDRLADSLFKRFSAEFLRHLSVSLVFAWITVGLLACVLKKQMFRHSKPFRLLQLATTDTAVLMGSLAALFLVFGLLQLGYLFGGRETIEATSGLTLAQYARRGFFELLAVAGLTLIALIAIAGTGCNQRVFRPLAAILISCVLVIQISAMQRLLLYIEAFGLTIDRLAALAVMAWIAGGILLFAGTILRGQARLFATGMTSSGIAVVFLLGFSNPASLVAKVNIEKAIENQQPLDTLYLLNLGTDAAPVLLENLERLPLPLRCQAAVSAHSHWYDELRWPGTSRQDWQGWTYSQFRAVRLIGNYGNQLKTLAADCQSGA